MKQPSSKTALRAHFLLIVGIASLAWTPQLFASTAIHLKARSIQTEQVASLPLAEAGAPGRNYLLVQFKRLPSAKTLIASGVAPVGQVDDRTVVLFAPNNSVVSVLPELGASWVGMVAPLDRLSVRAEQAISSASAGASVNLLVTGYETVSEAEMAAIATRNGALLLPRLSLPSNVALMSGPAVAFSGIANENAVSWISLPSAAVLEGSEVGWCPGAESEYGIMPAFATVGNGWDGPGLGAANDLKIRLLNATQDKPNLMPFSVQQTLIKAAFNEWARYAQICATTAISSGQPRTIELSFVSPPHNDGLAQLGAPHDHIAHAFYPAPLFSEPRAGDVHFDEAETWAVVPIFSSEYDLFSTALHEIGHALGLEHVDGPLSAMNPDIPSGRPGVHSLSFDDINGIRALYAPRTIGMLPPSDCLLPF